MKKILYTLLVLFIFSSCNQDFEEVFDKNPAERKAEARAELTNMLANAEHGWKTRITVGDKVKAGDFFLLNFTPVEGQNNGDVTIVNLFNSSTSEFEVHSENGSVLNFNTYNEVFYWLVSPNAWEPGGIGSDLEFVYLRKEDGKLYFRAKSKDFEMVLEPATEEDWNTTYIYEQFENFRSHFSKNFTGIRLTKGMGASEENPFVSVFFDAYICNSVGFSDKKDVFYGLKYWIDGQRKELDEGAFVYSTEGVLLSNPLVIAGDTVSKLVYNKEADIWEIANEGLEGELISSDLPIYPYPGAVDKLIKIIDAAYGEWWLTPWGGAGKISELIIPVFNSEKLKYFSMCTYYNAPDGKEFGPGLLFDGRAYGVEYAYFPMKFVHLSEYEFKLERDGEMVSNIEDLEPWMSEQDYILDLFDLMFSEAGWSIAMDDFLEDTLHVIELYNIEDPTYVLKATK
jgi:hypothetical protein